MVTISWTAPRTWVAAETLTASLLNTHLRDNLLAAHPVGSLHYYIQAATTSVTTINGFALEANATTPVRATYADLNTLLSGLAYPFGNGNGTTTFTLPDLQGRVLVGMASGGHAQVNGIGDSDGYTKTTRTPFHQTSYASADVDITDPGHSHTYLPPGSILANTAGGTNSIWDGGGDQTGSSLTGITAALSGTLGPTGTRPEDVVPYLVAGIWAVRY